MKWLNMYILYWPHTYSICTCLLALHNYLLSIAFSFGFYLMNERRTHKPRNFASSSANSITKRISKSIILHSMSLLILTLSLLLCIPFSFRCFTYISPTFSISKSHLMHTTHTTKSNEKKFLLFFGLEKKKRKNYDENNVVHYCEQKELKTKSFPWFELVLVFFKEFFVL